MKERKKPLLVGFTELERGFIKKEAAKLGVTETAYIRAMINRRMQRVKDVQ